MSGSSGEAYVFTDSVDRKDLPIGAKELAAATKQTNAYLLSLPSTFGATVYQFYSILGIRNLSGFVGEVLKHAINRACPHLVPNPHPDGRPDILDLSSNDVRHFFDKECFDGASGTPLRKALAPFSFGGIEIKATIGDSRSTGKLAIGQSRVNLTSGLNFWAHHAHECSLLGVYYDFCARADSSPQIKALFFCHVSESDWHKVSIGRPDRKKTSNTSLNRTGRDKLRRSLVMCSNESVYINLFAQLGHPPSHNITV